MGSSAPMVSRLEVFTSVSYSYYKYVETVPGVNAAPRPLTMIKW